MKWHRENARATLQASLASEISGERPRRLGHLQDASFRQRGFACPRPKLWF